MPGAISVRSGGPAGNSVAAIRLEVWSVALTVFAGFGAVMLLGISKWLAILAIGASAGQTLLLLIVRPQVPLATLCFMLLVLYALINAVMLGGIESLSTGGLLVWLEGEGRLFICFWPFFLLTMWMQGRERRITVLLEQLFSLLTVALLLAVLARSVGGLRPFSSHHAAGALAASLMIFNLYRFQRRRGLSETLMLGLSAVSLIGTGSRTAVVAVLLGLLLTRALLADFRSFLRLPALALPALLAMPWLFPDHFARLAKTFQSDPAAIVSGAFRTAWHAEPPLESGDAWSLSELVGQGAQVNLAIRGLLWARGISEGMRSPLLGAGFGRFNDTGRDFTGRAGLVKVATDARFANPSVHSAHNSYVMVFAELGAMGLGLLLSGLWLLASDLLRALRLRDLSPDERLWAGVGFASLVTLCLIGVTQHAFGAPIYGLTLLQMVALGHGVARHPGRRAGSGGLMLLSGAAYVLLLMVVGEALGLAAVVAASRLLPIEASGLFILLQNNLFLFGTLATLGLGTTFQRFLPRYQQAGAVDEMRALIRKVLAWSACGAAVSAAGFVLVQYLARQNVPLTAAQQGLFILCIFGWSVVVLNRHLMRALRLGVVSEFSYQLVRPAGALLVLAATAAYLPPTTVVLMMLLVPLLAGLVHDARGIGPLVGDTLNGPASLRAADWKVSSFHFTFVTLGRLVMQRLDVLVVGALLGLEAAAIYGIAARVSVLVAVAAEPIQAVFQPRASLHLGSGRVEALHDDIVGAVCWTGAVSLGVAALLLVAPGVWLAVFGDSVRSGISASLLGVMIAGRLVAVNSGTAQSLLLMAGHERPLAVIGGGLSLVIYPAVLVLATLGWGMSGAALATAGARVLDGLVRVALAWRYTGNSTLILPTPGNLGRAFAPARSLFARTRE